MDIPDPENTKDLYLLRNDPKGLVLHYQPLIGIIIRKYTLSGMFLPEEFEDVRQTINEHLLFKLPRIQRQYNGTTFVRTYLSAIIRNICLKQHKKKRRVPKLVPIGDPPDTYDQSSKYAMDYARGLIRAILKQYDHRNRLPKLLLCLKLRFRIPIEENDVLRWFPSCPQPELDFILDKFGDNYDNLSDGEVYDNIISVINKAEGKENKEDSVRKWTQSRISEIIELLNGTPRKSSFDEDTLKILIEDYFSPFLEKEG